MDFDFPDLPFELPDPLQDFLAAVIDGRFADVVNLLGGGPIIGSIFDPDRFLEQVRDFWNGPDPK